MIIKKEMITIKYFISNINRFIAYKQLKSIRCLSLILNINYQRLESWLTYQRVPSLKMLDFISNTLNVNTYELIGKEINFSKTNTPIKKNNSGNEFRINLRKYLNKYDIKSASDFTIFFDNRISTHTYYSYFKTKSNKMPSLRTIEFMSHFFNIQPYQLIERNDVNGK